MKKRSVLILSIVLSMLGMHNVSAQVISASLDAEAVTVGKDIVLSVTADVENASGIQFDIEYDEDVLEYSQSQTSDFFDDAIASGINTDNPGSISVIMGFVEEQEISGEILNVSFKAVGNSGNKVIKINNVKIVANGEKMKENTLEIEFKTKGKASSGSAGTKGSAGGNISTAVNSGEKTEDIGTAEDEAPQQEEKAKPEFTDISGHWAEESIKNMVSEGVISGFEDNTFAPDRNIKRSEFAVMISKAFVFEEETENVYSDVPEDAWYAEGVLGCTAAGIIMGSDGMFRPDDMITREEMAAVIYRAEKYFNLAEEVTETETVFADNAEISEWAKEAIIGAVKTGIISGMNDNTFAPKSHATRAQAAVVLERFLVLQWN